ncbi:unnamed protein product [Rotaria magnacalcarata]|uniref:Uncharacterized protein n=1 Tax=Rotaria magnacalcarata TaxID=392030 RepID=A0A820E5C5_9BILA|nr:unnamed protein product [Rotaria magnacalcarata]CAF2234769.1 unnamed protein product [Rotaria magnacalcarata]CAF4242958.1 unnamed protein product [Rotaria magnacalcarata]CAF4280860.1 unnamed protein product [Rotaria magnacalcarata]
MDGSFVIKTGVKTGFKCLRDLLTKKAEEKLKQSKNAKAQPQTTATFNILSSSSSSSVSSFSTPSITTISSPPQATVSPPPQTTVSPLSDEEFNLDTFDLENGKDFFLNFFYNNKNELEASVKCKCGRLITLTLKSGNIQLSNFHKHLRMTSCNHIKTMKKTYEEQRKLELQRSTSASSLPADATSTTITHTQQSKLQVPGLASSCASSTISSRSSNISTPVPEKKVENVINHIHNHYRIKEKEFVLSHRLLFFLKKKFLLSVFVFTLVEQLLIYLYISFSRRTYVHCSSICIRNDII